MSTRLNSRMAKWRSRLRERSSRLASRPRPLCWALAFSTLFSVVATGWQQPTFRTEARLVVLHATVRNGRGELLTGLDSTAFTVYENGKRQPITLFRRDD